MELLTNYALWASFFSLTALEIVLGIDNVVFIALIVSHLPRAQREKARVLGLSLALGMRIAMLFGIVWIIGLKAPWIQIFDLNFSGKDLMMLVGGLFLLHKATSSIHDEVTGDQKTELQEFKGGFASTILQIVFIDLIFSFDSVITAVGLTENIPVIVAAMTVAMIVMLASSGYISSFISKYPTIKMLAMSFVMMIGVLLVAEGFGMHVPKGYIYFGMAFSLGVELLNILVRKKKSRKSKSASKVQ
jgi:predicted tellurium resistance membrane protein TerC